MENNEKAKGNHREYTAARAAANKRWNSKQFQLAVRIPPEVKAALDEHLESRPESIAGFVVRAIKETIEHDNSREG